MMRARLSILPALLLAVTMTSVGAQAPQPLPRFEVASVKPSTEPTRFSVQPGGRIVATQSLKQSDFSDVYVRR